MGGRNANFLSEILVALGLLVLCTLAFRIVVWLRQDMRGSARRHEDALSPFRDALEAGELDREEYERIRDAMERQRSRDDEPAPRLEQPPRPTDTSGTAGAPSADPS